MNIEQVWPEWHEDCVLGEGSFGKVYRVRRNERNKVFFSAVKVLTVPKSQQEIKHARAQGMNDEEIYSYFEGFVDDLLNEIILMENLKGAKNIVGIDDYKIIKKPGEIRWDIYIRMELLTPFDSFASNPDFSQINVIKLGVDLCTALEMCEQNQIVHRDIKPDNIFVSKFGEYKLGDFGIARQLDKTNANLSRKGTLNYMAPEVYRGDMYGKSVDLYSLGLVMYTLLNNNRVAFLPKYPQPITFKDNEIALSKRLSGERMELPCNASPSLGQVIVKACAFRPEDRYQSATEFKNSLLREWNVLAQSGTDIGSNASVPASIDYSSNYNPENTTNDMTVHGRLLVNELNQNTTLLSSDGTTVLNQDSSVYERTGENTLSPLDYSNTYTPPEQNTVVAGNIPKHNKICKYLALPFAAAAFIASFFVFMESDLGVFTFFSVLGITLNVFIGKNRISLGTSVLIYALPQAINFLLPENITELLNFNIGYIVLFVCNLLMSLGGLSMILQKEVRLGGTLTLYATIFHIIYAIVDSEYLYSPANIVILITVTLAIILWAYGYNSLEKTNLVKNILKLAAFVVTALTAFVSLVYYYSI